MNPPKIVIVIYSYSGYKNKKIAPKRDDQIVVPPKIDLFNQKK
jgi:hypothetical protein